MEKQIARAFQAWCKSALSPHRKPSGTDAAEFYVRMQRDGADLPKWQEVHRMLMEQDLIH